MSQEDLDTVINNMDSDGSLDSEGDDVDFDPKHNDSSSSAESSVCHTDDEDTENALSHGDTVQVKFGDDMCSVKILRVSVDKITAWSDISYGMKSVPKERDALVAFCKKDDLWVELDVKQEIDLIKEHWTAKTSKKTLGSVFFQRVSQLRKKPSSSTKEHLRIVSNFEKCKSVESGDDEIVLVASDRAIAFAKSEADAASKEREKKKAEKKKKSAEIVVDSPQSVKCDVDTEAESIPVIKIKEDPPEKSPSNEKKRKRTAASQDESHPISLTPSICQRQPEVGVDDTRSVCAKKIVLSIEYSNMQSAKADLEKLSQVL